ncbi:MAG: hypothetical protein WCI56_11675 [Hyphomicrobiales bacterium]
MAHVLVKNLSANAFGQFVNLANTVFLVPLYLATWGVELYGEWLVLVALPAYFLATADGGFMPVAANEMSIKMAQDRRDEVLRIYHSTWLFISALSILVVLAIAGAMVALGADTIFRFSKIQNDEAENILFCLLLMFVIYLQQGMTQTGLRTVGHYAQGVMVYNLTAFTETVCIAAALFLGARPLTIALLSLAARFVALASNVLLLRQKAAWLKQGVRHARWSEIRRLFVPAVAFLGIPAGNAAIIQGVIIVLHQALGPVAVALYTTTRTLTRMIVQSVGLLAVSSWPEISRYFGAGRMDVLRLMFTHGTQLSAIAAAGFGLLVILAGPFIMVIWTGGRIEPDHMLIAALTAAAMMVAMRAFPETILLATNNHIRYSAYYVSICLGVTAACYPVAKNFGLFGAGILIALGDAVLMAISFRAVTVLLGLGAMPWREILTSRPPLGWLLGKKLLD